MQANAWETISPSSGTAPSARAYHTGVWDWTNGRMWIFGGASNGVKYNDLHYYDVQALLFGWWLGLECWDVVKSRDSSRLSTCEMQLSCVDHRYLPCALCCGSAIDTYALSRHVTTCSRRSTSPFAFLSFFLFWSVACPWPCQQMSAKAVKHSDYGNTLCAAISLHPWDFCVCPALQHVPTQVGSMECPDDPAQLSTLLKLG